MIDIYNVHVFSLNQTPLDWQGNYLRIKESLVEVHEKSREENYDPLVRQDLYRKMVSLLERNENGGIQYKSHDLILFQELTISGCSCEDMFLSDSTLTAVKETLTRIIPFTKDKIVVIGLPWQFNDRLYKAAAVLHDGQLIGISCARSIAARGIHYDRRWFETWTDSETMDIWNNVEIPIGKDIYELNGLTFGIQHGPEIMDSWSDRKIDLLLCPSAEAFELGVQKKRRDYLTKMSGKLDCTIVYANPVGNESGTVIYDGGSFIASCGKSILQNFRFSYLYQGGIFLDFYRKDKKLQLVTDESDGLESWETSENYLYEELARAIPLGLADYISKTRSGGFTLSLSGGADSASLAVFIRLMVHFGLKSDLDRGEAVLRVDSNDFISRLFHIPAVKALYRQQKVTAETLMPAILTTVYQATANSGLVTKNAAEQMARAVGSTHYYFNIDSLVHSYEDMISSAIGRPLSWKNPDGSRSSDDLALQNIQARCRVPGVWLLANLNSSLLLSTGNRSEAACGYATMDGDTCGGLSPIAGIDKAFLRRWLAWMEKLGPNDTFPIPELRYINEQAPTAELRPGSTQTDEGDLMPYIILNLFEQAIIRDKLSAAESLVYVEREQKQYQLDYSRRLLLDWQEKFYRFWARSQWKRARCAPGFHLDDHDVAPGSWCRFPLLSGGFQTELQFIDEERKKSE